VSGHHGHQWIDTTAEGLGLIPREVQGIFAAQVADFMPDMNVFEGV